jgi:hypothetical protein
MLYMFQGTISVCFFRFLMWVGHLSPFFIYTYMLMYLYITVMEKSLWMCYGMHSITSFVVCDIIKAIDPGLLCLHVATMVLYPACVYNGRWLCIVTCRLISRKCPKYMHATVGKMLKELCSVWSVPCPLLDNGLLNTFP